MIKGPVLAYHPWGRQSGTGQGLEWQGVPMLSQSIPEILLQVHSSFEKGTPLLMHFASAGLTAAWPCRKSTAQQVRGTGLAPVQAASLNCPVSTGKWVQASVISSVKGAHGGSLKAYVPSLEYYT